MYQSNTILITVAVIFLITSYLAARVLVSSILPSFKNLLLISSSYIVGYILSFWSVLILSIILNQLIEEPIIYAVLIITALQIFIIIKYRSYMHRDLLSYGDIIFVIAALLFSLSLFTLSFNYDQVKSEIQPANHVWGDFGLHIPLIRSFSLGNNLGLENPVFANETLRYHFMFDFSVGVLEKMGIPLDYAMNIPSALSFLCLMILIYELAYLLFNKNRFIAYLSVFFFLFNSSLAVIEFLKKYPEHTLKKIIDNLWHLKGFAAAGPWDGSLILIFWNLNVYINQRHIAIGSAVFLIWLIILISYKSYKIISFNNALCVFLGLVTGLTLMWHGMAFLCLFGVAVLFFLTYTNRKGLLLTLIIAIIAALPQFLFLQKAHSTGTGIAFIPGFYVNSFLIGSDYLSSPALNRVFDYILSFLRLWFYNIGLNIILIPASFFLLGRKNKKIFLIILSLFVFGNFVRIGVDIAGNHKIFNFWLIVSNIFTAYLIYRLFEINLITKAISILLIFLLTVSGIVDIMPIKNSIYYGYKDIQKDPLAKWVFEKTKQGDVFQTTYRFYNPIALAGRMTMQFHPVWAWAQGYDVDERKELSKKIYRPQSVVQLCSLLKDNNIDYVQTEKEFDKEPVFKIDHEFYKKHFRPVFVNKSSTLNEKIYSRDEICSKTNLQPQ